jgi:NADH dehydrogenase [ubiquinone] 1 alpha subcomplex assembly factor 7
VLDQNKIIQPYLEAVYLVEASPSLRDAQKRLLCGEAAIEKTELGWKSPCKYLNGVDIVWYEDIKFVPKGNCL